MMENLISVLGFGLLGVLSRYSIDKFFVTTWSTDFPISIFLINILGSFLAGVIYVYSNSKGMSPALQTGLLIGFCGGFTTFSSYTLQTFTLLEKGKFFPAISYFLLSPTLGLCAVYITVTLMRKI